MIRSLKLKVLSKNNGLGKGRVGVLAVSPSGIHIYSDSTPRNQSVQDFIFMTVYPICHNGIFGDCCVLHHTVRHCDAHSRERFIVLSAIMVSDIFAGHWFI